MQSLYSIDNCKIAQSCKISKEHVLFAWANMLSILLFVLITAS